jgi:hypothetical protein
MSGLPNTGADADYGCSSSFAVDMVGGAAQLLSLGIAHAKAICHIPTVCDGADFCFVCLLRESDKQR